MRNDAEPSQRAGFACRQLRDLAGPGLHIQLCAEAVIGRELVQGQLASLGKRPLIDLGQFALEPNLSSIEIEQPRSDLLCFRLVDSSENLTGVGEYGPLPAKAIGGTIHDGEKLYAVSAPPSCAVPPGGSIDVQLFGRVCQCQPDFGQVEVRHPRKTKVGVEARHSARIHHHDPACEPHGEKQAQRDPKIAVRQNQELA